MLSGKELARQALQSLYLKYKSFNRTKLKIAMESCSLKAARGCGAKLIDHRPQDIHILLNSWEVPNVITRTTFFSQLMLLLR